jgi:hypothetical protein
MIAYQLQLQGEHTFHAMILVLVAKACSVSQVGRRWPVFASSVLVLFRWATFQSDRYTYEEQR